jgi:DNA-binding transcriptional ArsR family regulator
VAARRKKFVQRPVVLEDAKSIKALAHPARLAIIDELFAGRELTATECAEIVGMSPSAMSYHLRALERAGMIERAPSSDDGRERPWRAKGTSITVNSTSSKLALAATTALATTVVERLGAGLRDWLARGEQEDPAWREVAGVSDARLWLTRQEAEQVERSSREFVEQFRGRTADNHPEGARRVRVTVLMYPTDDGSS